MKGLSFSAGPNVIIIKNKIKYIFDITKPNADTFMTWIGLIEHVIFKIVHIKFATEKTNRKIHNSFYLKYQTINAK